MSSAISRGRVDLPQPDGPTHCDELGIADGSAKIASSHCSAKFRPG
jgi:hypothetical protein